MQDLQAWKQRDPVRRLEQSLLAAGIAAAADLARLHESVTAEVAAAAARALEAPWPETSALLDLVYVS
jgi:TPP-dependent pyruvate/acetoin dehydrogenase alpha subunit